MRVKLVYRNYKPLHKVYESLVSSPPEDIDYVVPTVQAKYRKLYPLYVKIRYFALGRFLIRMFEQIVFTQKDNHEDVDLYQYVNMIDENPPLKPYIVDLEHAASLLSFSPNPKRLVLVKKFLADPLCKSIDCMTEAAKRSLQKTLGDSYDGISHKVHVVYPGLEQENFEPDYSYIPKSTKTLQLLFVGNNAYLKGLQEVLKAVETINNKISKEALQLHVISSDGEAVMKQYSLPNTRLYPPTFSKEEIFSMFFMPADVFVIPTKEDTFGMSILDSFVCGTPVIATDQFAIPELVNDKKDGLLVHLDKALLDSVIIPSKEEMQNVTAPNLNEQTVKELAQVLETLITGKVDLKKMGKAGRQKFESGQKFSIDTRNKKILDIYKNALS